jgi:adenylosuccinate lyase
MIEDIFDCVSPLDFRYYGRNEKLFSLLWSFVSERAYVKYQARVEAALVRVLAKRGVCSKQVASEIEGACSRIEVSDVYREEDRIRHNIRALVNCIRSDPAVSEEAKRFIHLTLTSFDVLDTASALRFKEATSQVIIPTLLDLEKSFIKIALREKDTIQIGRTHGQHSIPLTFGFAMAEYVSRLGNRILAIRKAGNNLVGKISGAVGNYNASSLFFDDPEEFEREVLHELGLEPADYSTQIVEPEYLVDYVHALVSCFGVLANFADDMRHLQRTEISEVAEEFKVKDQVGSSTMPHKRNPINFENVKSMWKVFMPRMTTIYMDQISEHQRDLTNSASLRFVPEILVGLVVSAFRLKKVCQKLIVDKKAIERNFEMSKKRIIAEPAYILLASKGHPNAHECIRKLTVQSLKEGRPLRDLIIESEELKPYLAKLTNKQQAILDDPSQYLGIASKKTEQVCAYWKQKLGI